MFKSSFPQIFSFIHLYRFYRTSKSKSMQKDSFNVISNFIIFYIFKI
ncbi:210L [Invertebrate iridescent virus 6]|uniref:210L n=1 Tax=Invertebrate iridescent virus 6 TaxID=176652 RepID=Q91FW1_IIV6|nr:210L [Invertebrate iridescent virus 6]AAK82072.1 210L [Invertebrate iridescent virus 6]